MSLTWRQFHAYLDAFTWLLREETEDGRRKNYKADLIEMTQNPKMVEWKKRLVEDANRKLSKIKQCGVNLARG